MNEILGHVNRDGVRYIVVWFADSNEIEVIPDLPYVWRMGGQYIDRSEECS